MRRAQCSASSRSGSGRSSRGCCRYCVSWTIGCVAHSPVGRGLLAGKILSPGDLGTSDWRRNNPRFQEGNIIHNLSLVSVIKEIASAHDATPAQLALAWLLRRGSDIVPIPGIKRLRYLEENAQAVGIKLCDAVWSALDERLATFKVVGERYPEEALRFIDNSE